MGAFCVFGISRGDCRLKAEKKVPSWDEKQERCLTMIEWAQRRDELAASLFETSTRPVKISPEFDAPQFCADWLAVAPAQVKLTKIMVRGPKVDKAGNPVMRGGGASRELDRLPAQGRIHTSSAHQARHKS